MVEKGSIKTASDGVTIDFIVEDGKAKVPVRFRGITPDLFVEGSGVVAEGRMEAGGRFIADNLLAKHDENYVSTGRNRVIAPSRTQLETSRPFSRSRLK